MKVEHVPQKSCINSLYVLHKTIWSFMNITVRHDYHDYVGKIWNESGNVYPYTLQDISYKNNL